jgi:hypothetical protein
MGNVIVELISHKLCGLISGYKEYIKKKRRVAPT